MDAYSHHKIVRTNEGYELILYLNPNTEFSMQLGEKPKDGGTLKNQALTFMHTRKLSAAKITKVTIMLGTLMVTSFHTPNDVEAATTPAQQFEQKDQTVKLDSYNVVSGDSLSVIARRHHVTLDQLKAVNHLDTDLITIGQTLRLPFFSYVVQSGDSLSMLAKDNQTTVDAIKQINQLRSDHIQIGQQLKIPSLHDDAISSSRKQTFTYSVVAGDSLSVIARRFQTSVPDLMETNQLKSDVLRIGQELTIHTSSPNNLETSVYRVKSGDSLSVIAQRFGTTVSELKSRNNLTSDLLQIGQELQINGMEKAETKQLPHTYTVVAGDTLSRIAKQFDTDVHSLKVNNDLRSDVLQIGQVLKLNDQTTTSIEAKEPTLKENTITYITHTVVSGDNIWNLSVHYGIPQTELLHANNLTTTSSLSIGQELSVPVHHIAVHPVFDEQYGEHLDWWTEAQYVFHIGKTAKVTDMITGESFTVKRTIGANHADVETLTVEDTNIAKKIWGGYSWRTRAVIVEVDGRKLAASMSFYPHDVQFIDDNGMNGHVDIHFKNSTRHVDGAVDPLHQEKINRAAGVY